MNTYEMILKLCERDGIAVTALEKELGFGRGSIGKSRKKEMSLTRLQKIADYFGVSVDYLTTGKDTEKESSSGKKYYFNDETAAMAQSLYENSDTRMLFNAARDSRPEDLQMAADLLKRLKETNPSG